MDERSEERREGGPVLAEPGMPGSASAEEKPVAAAGHRRRSSPAERLELLRQFEKTPLGRDEFCAAHGLSLCTLGKWLKRYREGGEAGLVDKPNPRNAKGASRRWYSPEERRAALEEFGRSGLGQREFARVWGVALKTLSVWLKRHSAGGPKALEPKKRGRPRGSGGKPGLPAPVRERILKTKQRFPAFGLRKVRDFLVRFHGLKVSTGGVRRTLRAEGIGPVVVRKKRRRSSDEPRSFERSRPGELWQSDITSFVLTRHSQRVYLTVFLDDFSRYIVSFGLHVQMRSATVIEALLEGTARYGKPKEVLTDQGPQYFTWRGKSAFQKLLVREGIRHVVARSHHPQTVGKCERLWETVSREFWERVQPQDLSDARTRLAHFFAHYNHFRPHQGIGGMVPADRFFGTEEALRKSIEEQVSKNELQLALGQPLRKSVHMVMQVGDQSLSLHGEKGKLVIRTSTGEVREIGLEELGMPQQGGKEQSDGDDDDERGLGGVLAERGGDGGGNGGGAAHAVLQEAGALQALPAAGDRGEGALELGQRGGEEPRSPALHDDAGAVAWAPQEAGGDGAPGRAGAAPVADVAVGALGYAGGASQAAADEGRGNEGRRECGDGPAERSEEALEAGPGSGEGERDPEESRQSPEGSAGQPGREARS